LLPAEEVGALVAVLVIPVVSDPSFSSVLVCLFKLLPSVFSTPCWTTTDSSDFFST